METSVPGWRICRGVGGMGGCTTLSEIFLKARPRPAVFHQSSHIASVERQRLV